MPQPSVWTRLTNFLGYATANPSATYPPALIDQEFDAARTTVQELRTNIALIQRDDGRLKNGSVHPDSLSAATRVLISDWNPRGDWATATVYALKDVVEEDGVWYVCIVAHTSGASFAVDLAAARWMAINLDMAALANTNDAMLGDYLLGVKLDAPGAVARTQHGKNAEIVSVTDFYANGVSGVAVDPTGVVDSTLGIQAALDSGAKKVFVPKGTYLVSASLEMVSGQTLEGDGEQDTIIKASGNITVFPLTAGRECLRDISIHGESSTPAGYTGTGIEVGTASDWTAHVVLERVTCRYLTRGLSIKAALWFTCIQGRFQFNTYGCDFNAGAGKYSTTVTFIDTKFANNQRNGVGATAAPVTNRTFKFIGGSFENNGLGAPGTYSQAAFTALGGLSLDNVYFESAGTGGYPDACNLTGVSDASIITPYINGSDEGFIATSNTCNNITFINPRFVGTQTRCFNLPACVDIVVLHPTEDIDADVLTGFTTTKVDNKIAQLRQQNQVFTPVLTGTSGTSAHTYVWQYGYYTQIGNVIFFSGAVRISAKDAGMTGNATITGLPATSYNALVQYATVACLVENVTFSANKNQVYGQIVNNSAVMALMQQDSAGGGATALPSSSISNTTIIYFTGHYLVASV